MPASGTTVAAVVGGAAGEATIMVAVGGVMAIMVRVVELELRTMVGLLAGRRRGGGFKGFYRGPMGMGPYMRGAPPPPPPLAVAPPFIGPPPPPVMPVRGFAEPMVFHAVRRLPWRHHPDLSRRRLSCLRRWCCPPRASSSGPLLVFSPRDLGWVAALAAALASTKCPPSPSTSPPPMVGPSAYPYIQPPPDADHAKLLYQQQLQLCCC